MFIVYQNPGIVGPILWDTVVSYTYIAQEFDHALWPVDAHQNNFVAEQDLQGHKYQDLTRATDHLVPHPKDKGRPQSDQYKSQHTTQHVLEHT